jgi:light-regulated signal transduction histidine kinase (bacteriophytochrome)
LINWLKNINTQIETISLQECLNEVSTSINSLIHDSKAKINLTFLLLTKLLLTKPIWKVFFLNLLTNAIKYKRPHTHYYNTIQIVNGINQLIFSDQGSGFDMDKVKDKILAYMKISW